MLITKNGWEIILPDRIRKEEEISLSDAYSSLKELYLHLKLKYSNQKDIIKELRRENEDYKQRYNHLIKHLQNDTL